MSEEKELKWGKVIALLIFVWPVGLYLLIKKTSEDKMAAAGKSKIVAMISFLFIALGINYMILAFQGDPGGVTGVVVFGGAGTMLILYAIKMKKTAQKMQKYINIVSSKPVMFIADVATACGVTYEVAKKDLQELIDDDYLEDAYINEGTREVVTGDYEEYEDEEDYEEPVEKVVVCSGCGAKSVIIEGRISKCEYCGNLLE